MISGHKPSNVKTPETPEELISELQDIVDKHAADAKAAERPIGQAIRAYIEHQFLNYPYDIYSEEIKKSIINFFTNSIKKIKEVFEDAYQIEDLFVNILEGQYARHNIKPREQEKKSEEKQEDKENKVEAKEEKLKATEELTQEEKEEVRNAIVNWDLKKIKILSKRVNINEFYSLEKSGFSKEENKYDVLDLLFFKKPLSYQILDEFRNVPEFKNMELLSPDKQEYLGRDIEGIFLARGYPGIINCEELRVKNLEKTIHAYFNQADIRSSSASGAVLSARKQLVRQYIPALALAYQSTVEKIKQIIDLLLEKRIDINGILAYAVQSGNIELVIHALNRGADVNFVPPDSEDKGCPEAFKVIITCCEKHGILTSNKLLEIFFRKGIAPQFVKELSDRIDREIQYFNRWGSDHQKLLAVRQLKKQLEEHSKLQKERLDSRATLCFGLFKPQPPDCALQHVFANSPIFDKSLVSLLFKF